MDAGPRRGREVSAVDLKERFLILEATRAAPKREITASALYVSQIRFEDQGIYYPELAPDQLQSVRTQLQEWRLANSDQVKFEFLP